MKDLELYIHIPFCVRKCLYCDFLSAPAGEETKEKYMDALLSEIVYRAEECRDYCVVSVFFGGGTPSVVRPERIRQVMNCVRDNYQVAADAEITMEVNPGTVTEEALLFYREAGINRLSIGLQSAEDDLLERLGRIHDWRQFCETFSSARRAGFENINVDVMSGLPGQSREAYCETLRKVCELEQPPEHISAYSLIVEEGTPLACLVDEGRLAPADEELEREMYEDTKTILQEYGFWRYEISNYARDGYACRHNIGYWTGVEYLGLGIGAASMMRDIRYGNRESLTEYLESPVACREVEEKLDEKARMEEFCFLGLRLIKGISGKDFSERFHVPLEGVYGNVIEKNSKDGLLICEKEQGGKLLRVRLTDRGLDLANYVMAQFLLD